MVDLPSESCNGRGLLPILSILQPILILLLLEILEFFFFFLSYMGQEVLFLCIHNNIVPMWLFFSKTVIFQICCLLDSNDSVVFDTQFNDDLQWPTGLKLSKSRISKKKCRFKCDVSPPSPYTTLRKLDIHDYYDSCDKCLLCVSKLRM